MTGPILPVTLDIHTLRSSMVDYRINSNIIRQNAQTPIWSITSDIKAQVSHEQKVSDLYEQILYTKVANFGFDCHYNSVAY